MNPTNDNATLKANHTKPAIHSSLNAYHEESS